MQVIELKALLIEYINEVVEDRMLPANIQESNINILLLKPDIQFEDFRKSLAVEYKSVYSHVSSVKVPAEPIKPEKDKLSRFDIGLDTSIFVVEIKSFYEFKMRGEDEESEEEEEGMFSGGKWKSSSAKVLAFPERSLASQKGLVGLRNIGNTCYMNAGLQCLSNSIELTEYILKKRYETDVNKDNPLGSGGTLIKSYASLIFEMWNGDRTVFTPSDFKSSMGKFKNTVNTN